MARSRRRTNHAGPGKRSPKRQRWTYEPEENPKRKHAWKHDHPGFVEHRGKPVSKCPSGISMDEAETLLNEGIPFPLEGWGKPWPQRIYVVHGGAVYRAVPTVPGRSYHAFPEFPHVLRRLPGTFVDALLDRARALGCEKEVRRWIRRKK